MPAPFNNREWAILIWGGLFVLACLTRSDLRRGTGALILAFLKWKLLANFAVMTAWILGLVIGGEAIGLWTDSELGDTIVWFLGAVFIVGMFGVTRVSEETGYVRVTVLRAVGFAAAIAGIEGLYVFPFLGEMILVLVLAILIPTGVVAKKDPESAPAARLIDVLLGLIALAILVYVGVHLVSDIAGAHIGGQIVRGPHCGGDCVRAVEAHRAQLNVDWRSLAMPVWLTVGLLPIVCAVGVLSAYEASFVLIDFVGDSELSGKAKRRAKCALVIGVNVHIRWLGEFRAPWPYRIAREPSLRSAIHVAREFRRTPLPAPEGSTQTPEVAAPTAAGLAAHRESNRDAGLR